MNIELLHAEFHHFAVLVLVDFFLHTMLNNENKYEVLLQASVMSFFELCVFQNKILFELKLVLSLLLCILLPRCLQLAENVENKGHGFLFQMESVWPPLKCVLKDIRPRLNKIWPEVKGIGLHLWSFPKKHLSIHFVCGVAVQTELGENLLAAICITVLFFVLNAIWHRAGDRACIKFYLAFGNVIILTCRNDSIKANSIYFCVWIMQNLKCYGVSIMVCLVFVYEFIRAL